MDTEPIFLTLAFLENLAAENDEEWVRKKNLLS
jgi:hypothetical protein